MGTLVVKVIVMAALPLVVFWVGVWIMSMMSNRDYVTQQLRQVPTLADQKPLSQRCLGYDVGAVNRHWGALDKTALAAEQCFLELDLGFPFLYGGAFLSSMLIGWRTLDRPFHLLWLIVPVAVMMFADWTENLVQLGQLKRYAASP